MPYYRFNRFRWTEKIENPEIRKNVEELLNSCASVATFNRERMETESSDYEGARQDLQAVMERIYESDNHKEAEETNHHNPLWDAMMQIRPAMLGWQKRVPKRFISIIQEVLWTIVNNPKDSQRYSKKSDFFNGLHRQMDERQICAWRTLLSGGVVVEWKKDGKVLHCFPIYIPRDIAKEVGLKLTVKTENIEAHKAALSELRKRGLVPEKVGEALEILAEDLYAFLEKGRGKGKTQ